MPGMKSAHQEKIWDAAKKQAAKEGQAGNWKYVQAVYDKMVSGKHPEPKGERDSMAESAESKKEKMKEMLAVAAKRKMASMRSGGGY